MEYQVPQFIEVEDKVFGPLSLKQFIYIAGGIGLCVILLLTLPRFLGVLLAIPVAIGSGALAFYKVHNKSLADVIESAVNFYTKDRLYIWKREPKPLAPATPVAEPEPSVRPPMKLSRGKLKELAWSLDIKDSNPET